MKSISMKQKHQTDRNLSRAHRARRGTTLLVVIALLAILALMGVVFYTFSSQERSNAENFADAAINEADPGLQADVLFNWGLEQLIKGPDQYRTNSALWGGDKPRYSLIYNMIGNDKHPYNGQGINVVLDGTNGPDVDQGYNGTADGNPAVVDFNVSPVARGGVAAANGIISGLPQPDVDYTAPDINSLFLAHKGYVAEPGWWDPLGPTATPSRPLYDPTKVRLVIIPSFHRPPLLRDGTGTNIADTYNNSSMAMRVMRPHNDHNFIHREGAQTDSGSSRFSTNVFDGSGDPNPRAMGIWTGDGDTEYYLDVDNDGDGIREGVWLDLDFPPIEDPQNPGDYIIPMFSFTVYDADGLINVNTAGNMRQPNSINLNYTAPETFGNNVTGAGANPFLFLSRSNQGLSSPGEINPQWALTAIPPSPAGTLLNQHDMFFGTQPLAWPELSNMEYFFLNYGRTQYTTATPVINGTKNDVIDIYPGRWGEANRLYDAQRDNTGDNLFVVDTSGGTTVSFPRAGQTLVDDNADRYEGTNQSGSLQGSRSGAISFRHPLAHNGAGRTWGSGANYRRTSLSAGGIGSPGPAVWPAYSNFEIAGETLSTPPTTSIRWPAAFFNNSGSVARTHYLLDDSDEIVVDMEKVQRPYDEPFGPEEMAHLSLSGTDIISSGVTSRLNSLMPRNFGTTGGSNLDRRKRFTTMSWDRKQFSKAVSVNGAINRFPPPFATNPFRTELLELMGVGLPEGTIDSPHQLKLNLNQLLVFENTGTGRTVSYRPLTPHPGEDRNGNGSLDTGEDLNGNTVLDALPATAITTTSVYPPTTPAQQEYWARVDRQRMARDIYSLLYSLNSRAVPPAVPTYDTTNSSDVEELLQMAQFAVNVVDALDPDDVLTRFEYDTNLSNGWNLDDNPYSDDSGTTERKVVWGVEAQQLTLSEFLLVQCEDQMTDLIVTQFPDDKVDGADSERYFSAIELRNNLPNDVNFGTNGKWMLGLEVNNTLVSFAVPKNSRVSAGGLFTLLSTNASDTMAASGSGDPYSEFRVDLDGDSNFTGPGERIIPSASIAASDKIDMVTDQATSSTLVTILNSGLTASASGAGSFLSQADSDLIGATEIKIKLFRKAHLGRDTLLAVGGIPVPDDDNPWVLVDEITTDKAGFDHDVDTVATLTPKLDSNNMRSKERSEPLNKRLGELVCDTSGNNRNTIGLRNNRTTSNFTLWQPHFDRDFSSPVELFSVPIIGPDIQYPSELKLGALDNVINPPATSKVNNLISHSLVDSGGKQSGSEIEVAGIQKFLSQEGVTTTAAPTTNYNYWYRLFEYVEVPSRIHRQLANPMEDLRVPGKLNLNTIRHPSVLAALIDDIGDTENIISFSNYSTDIGNGRNLYRLTDRAESSDRDWWEEFITSRDAVDSVAGIALPGTPGSRPFRSFDFFGEPAQTGATTTNRDPRENTLLRSLPTDYYHSTPSISADPRQLFEVANRTEHTGGPSDFHTRHRILSKIMGNTTTRSNTFMVFMSVAYFEASGAGLTAHDGVVQIGDRAHGKTVNQPDYRGFFVIDRTRIEEAFEPTTEEFDHWKRLVRYRHLIQSIQED